MATLKCKMCGGAIDFEQGTTVCTCEYCGTKQTLPKLDDDRKANLYDRANHFRRNNEFDKAMSIYEQILNEDPSDAESYWSIVLCRYGIEYVEDPATHKRVPTVNRAQFTSVIADEDYKKALENADISQKSVYEEEAKAIDEIQKGILEISSKEEPFDVFICYKETDNNGRRTPDSVLANDLYHQLVQEGFKVFFSRITLEDKLGTAYEPYIFAALNSSKVMVVLGTKPEYFNAVWVKNEWSRYLALIRKGEKKMLIPAYKDMDPYDLPEEFSHLQAQDMTKLGFMQDLIRGIKKIVGTEEAKPVQPPQTVVNTYSSNVTALLKRGNMALEDGEWEKADGFFEDVLNQDAECADAYLGKFLVANKTVSLADYQKQIEDRYDYTGFDQLRAREPDHEHIRTIEDKYFIPDYLDKNDIKKIYYYDLIYNSALKSREEQKKEALSSLENDRTFTRMKQYAYGESKSKVDSLVAGLTATFDSRIEEAKQQDAESVERVCSEYAAFLEKADSEVEEKYRKACEKKEADYDQTVSVGRNATTSTGCEKAIDAIKKHYAGFKDSEDVLTELTAKAKGLKEKEEKEAGRKKKKTRNITIAVVSTMVVITAVILAFAVFIPNSKYKSAIALMDNGQYDEAITAFQALNGYKDSNDKIDQCNTLIMDDKYNAAAVLFDNGQYEEAITAFTDLNGYRDSNDYVSESKYQMAIGLKDNYQFEDAISMFTELGDYSDSLSQIEECNALLEMQPIYDNAVSLLNDGQYEDAMNDFREVWGYGDASEKITYCQEQLYNEAIELLDNKQYDEAIDALDVIVNYSDAEELIRNAYCYELIEEDHSVGDTVVFGNYQKTWEILDISGTQMLLLRTGFDGYKDFDSYSCDWNSSDIKDWLNNEYYENTFNDMEQNLIDNKGYGEVFFLSEEEYNTYRDIIIAIDECWWLRSPGHASEDVCYVFYNGNAGFGHSIYVEDNVRPAIWIDLSNV